MKSVCKAALAKPYSCWTQARGHLKAWSTASQYDVLPLQDQVTGFSHALLLYPALVSSECRQAKHSMFQEALLTAWETHGVAHKVRSVASGFLLPRLNLAVP